MTALDPETGLAKTTDNFYWEVEKSYNEVYMDYDCGGLFFEGYKVKLVEKEYMEGYFKKVSPWYYFGFIKEVWVEGKEEHLTRDWAIVSKYDTGESKAEEAKDKFSYKLTKEALVKVTTELWEKYTKNERDRALTQALLGKYPPKSVKGLNDYA